MSHVTEIVGYQKLSNGQFKVCIRCCGLPDTDHWHVMAFASDDPAKRASNLEEVRQVVADQHAAAQAAEMELLAKMGDTKEHQ